MWRSSVLVAMLLMPAALVGGQSDSAEVQLKMAMHRELVDGDLRAAIKDYEAIVSRYRDSRAVVAKALLQLGLCHEKLGQPEARRIYEQLVQGYADQSDLVAQARARLAALSLSEPTSVSAETRRAVARPLPRIDRDNFLRALSSDGTRALFISREKGYDAAIHEFATKQSKRLTDFSTQGLVSDPIWSPDGRRVAYVRKEGMPDSVSELQITTLGGDSQVIFRNDANPGRELRAADWLPDGRTLLTVVERADRTSAIGLVPAAGGGPFTPLRSLRWTGSVPDRPRVSPDGRLIAFAEGTTGTRDIHILSLDGRTAARVTDHPADDHQPLWSPDGQHLAFVSTRFGSPALWAVRIKEGRPVGEPVRVKEAMQDVELIGWTSRGLAYAQTVVTADIYTAPLDRSNGQLSGEPRQLAYPRTGGNMSPTWSPDGRQLAFVSGLAGHPDRLYVVVLPDGDREPREFLIPRRTTRYIAPSPPSDLRWFGDGSGLGFSGLDAHGEPALFHLTLATGQWKIYPVPVKARTWIEWNADGSGYFFTRGTTDEVPGIFERDLKTDRERPVYRPRDKTSNFSRLRFGPDRRWLAFLTTTRDGDQRMRRMMVVNTESGEARTLIEETGPLNSVRFWTPAWLADGRTVVLPRDRGLRTLPELLAADLDGSAVRPLPFDTSFVGRAATVSGSQPTIDHVVWSSDGARMAILLRSFRIDGWVIENVLGAAGSTASARR